MLLRSRNIFDIKESQLTDESVYFAKRPSRRNILKAGLSLASLPMMPLPALAQENPKTLDGELQSIDAIRNIIYEIDRPLTDEQKATSYNNFYEFGASKRIWMNAQKLPVQPWQISIEGLVEKEKTFDIDDLIKKINLEERYYRHRCVETWAMAVPWIGFEVSKLLDLVQPLSKAKYILFESFNLPDIAQNQKQFWFPWPYTEGLSIEEAQNRLAFLAVGLYGKELPKQNGAPIRLVVPWKYGFKSIKSITKIIFTDKKPETFWNILQAKEYGFWANVNPDVPHPRWSQKEEKMLGTGKVYDTQIYNGYGDFVADLYKDLKDKEEVFF